MAHFVYIMHSEKLDRYYVGNSFDPAERVQRHLQRYYGNSYSSKAKDWTLRLQLKCQDRAHAVRLERFIKRMKSKKFIQKLIDSQVLQKEIILKCQ